jgi:hypothetical protein
MTDNLLRVAKIKFERGIYLAEKHEYIQYQNISAELLRISRLPGEQAKVAVNQRLPKFNVWP